VPELEALVGSVVELGQLTRTHTPHIDAVYALARLLLRTVAAPAQERTGAPHGPAAHVVASGAQGPSPVAWAEGVR
jgi:hypothetical protein